jgi:geranylgeranyl diphosphate synthase type I
MNEEFKKTLADYQKKINKEIELFFDDKIKKTKQNYLKSVLKTLKDFSLRPAKRLRAVLINQGYLLAGGKKAKEILKTSIFIELIHNYLLIHDDIVDDDNIRRGGDSLHYYYQKAVSGSRVNKEHFGRSLAIFAGDLMNCLAYEILVLAGFPDKIKITAASKLNEILISVSYGQMLETDLKRRPSACESDIMEIYRNKTASYSFVGPLQIGAMLAGAKKEFLDKIEKFALPLGVAYQIKDDLCDIESDTREKTPTLLREGKSIDYCSKKAKTLLNQSRDNLRKISFKNNKFIFGLIDYVEQRES